VVAKCRSVHTNEVEYILMIRDMSLWDFATKIYRKNNRIIVTIKIKINIIVNGEIEHEESVLFFINK